MRDVIKICGQALSVLLISVALAFAVNAIRKQSLPLVMPFPPEYQCPSLVQYGVPVKVEQALSMFARPDAAFVDARPQEDFEKGHIEGATNIPYSFIEPITKDTLFQLRRFRAVIVYCNTKDTEKSMLMAGELSKAGVDGAVYLEGGFLEWVQAGGKYQGQRPDHYE